MKKSTFNKMGKWLIISGLSAHALFSMTIIVLWELGIVDIVFLK